MTKKQAVKYVTKALSKKQKPWENKDLLVIPRNVLEALVEEDPFESMSESEYRIFCSNARRNDRYGNLDMDPYIKQIIDKN